MSPWTILLKINAVNICGRNPTSSWAVSTFWVLFRIGFYNGPDYVTMSFTTLLVAGLAITTVFGATDTELSGLPPVDAAVIGGGLSGLTAALRILQSGGTVTIIDKALFLGGNSAKVCP